MTLKGRQRWLKPAILIGVACVVSNTTFASEIGGFSTRRWVEFAERDQSSGLGGGGPLVPQTRLVQLALRELRGEALPVILTRLAEAGRRYQLRGNELTLPQRIRAEIAEKTPRVLPPIPAGTELTILLKVMTGQGYSFQEIDGMRRKLGLKQGSFGGLDYSELLSVCTDADATVFEQARLALKEEHIPRSWIEWIVRAGSKAEPLVPDLIDRLAGPTDLMADEERGIVRALAAIGPGTKSAIPYLEARIRTPDQDADSGERVFAVLAIDPDNSIGRKIVDGALHDWSADPNSPGSGSDWAFWGVGRLGSRGKFALPFLEPLLSDEGSDNIRLIEIARRILQIDPSHEPAQMSIKHVIERTGVGNPITVVLCVGTLIRAGVADDELQRLCRFHVHEPGARLIGLTMSRAGGKELTDCLLQIESHRRSFYARMAVISALQEPSSAGLVVRDPGDHLGNLVEMLDAAIESEEAGASSELETFRDILADVRRLRAKSGN